MWEWAVVTSLYRIARGTSLIRQHFSRHWKRERDTCRGRAFLAKEVPVLGVSEEDQRGCSVAMGEGENG